MANTISGDDGAFRRLVDIQYVAAYLGVTVRHVRRLVQEGRIAFIKWGRLLRFDLREIADWLDKWRHGC